MAVEYERKEVSMAKRFTQWGWEDIPPPPPQSNISVSFIVISIVAAIVATIVVGGSPVWDTLVSLFGF